MQISGRFADVECLTLSKTGHAAARHDGGAAKPNRAA